MLTIAVRVDVSHWLEKANISEKVADKCHEENGKRFIFPNVNT